MRLFWFALKQCLNAFQTLAPARLATPAAGPFLPQNGRKNFASPHCASLQNFAFILVQSPLKIALSCPFSPFPAFLHSSVPPRQHFITLHENSHSLSKNYSCPLEDSYNITKQLGYSLHGLWILDGVVYRLLTRQFKPKQYTIVYIWNAVICSVHFHDFANNIKP